MNFSDRMGLIKKPIQVKTVSKELRVSLWNELILFLNGLKNYQAKAHILKVLWIDEIKGPIDDFPEEPVIHLANLSPREILRDHKEREHYFKKQLPIYFDKLKNIQKKIRDYFFKCSWYKVYDFLECFVNLILTEEIQVRLTKNINSSLKEENSAYSLINAKFVPITDDGEIEESKLALNHPNKAVKEHMKQAFENLSLSSKNYRISAEESIKAVESLCKAITPRKTPTLGDAIKELKKMKDELEINELFLNAIEKLYGWANATLRHGNESEVPMVGIHEAKFVFLICSGIVNYLSSKTKINIE